MAPPSSARLAMRRRDVEVRDDANRTRPEGEQQQTALVRAGWRPIATISGRFRNYSGHRDVSTTMIDIDTHVRRTHSTAEGFPWQTSIPRTNPSRSEAMSRS